MVTTTAEVEPHVTARAVGLRYGRDDRPGIKRRRVGSGFSYVGPDGKAVRDEDTLRYIRSIGIPPAWTQVWISPDPDAHLRATGRDAKGRKQYRYHPKFREARDETKYDRLTRFARALPALRKRVEADLARPGMPREKILATVVKLLETTLIRVGNEEYKVSNDSYGLTTLQDHHADVRGDRIRFRFRGKSGKHRELTLKDPRLARIVKRSQDLPGEELLQYVDEEGVVRDIGSGDVNAYLRELTGEPFTAKDFRTWAGTVAAAVELRNEGPPPTARAARRRIVAAVTRVSERLGNTPSVCRKCYVHPRVIGAYEERVVVAPSRRGPAGLSSDELAVLQFLEAPDKKRKPAKSRGVPDAWRRSG